MKKTRQLFIDLDETLINTISMPYFEAYKTQKTANLSMYDKDVELNGQGVVFKSTCRKNANEFLAECRNRFENVYMLTAASSEYANILNRLYNFNFNKDSIFSCELVDAHYSPLGMGNSLNVLFDDREMYDKVVWKKLRWLENLGRVGFVKADPFFWPQKIDSELDISTTISYIESEFNRIEKL